MANKKYSLWTFDHCSVSTVYAYKVKDTNSTKEVDKWMDGRWQGASFYRSEKELPAEYLQTLPQS